MGMGVEEDEGGATADEQNMQKKLPYRVCVAYVRITFWCSALSCIFPSHSVAA